MNWHTIKIIGNGSSLRIWIDGEKQKIYLTKSTMRGIVRLVIHPYVIEFTNLNSIHTQKVSSFAISDKTKEVWVQRGDNGMRGTTTMFKVVAELF